MEFFSKKQQPFLFQLVIYSTHFSIDSWIFIYSMDEIAQYYINLIYQSHCSSISPLEGLSGWFLCPFNMSHSLCISLLSGPMRCSRFIHPAFFPASALESTTSPSSPGSFYWRMVFRNKDLNAEYVHRCWSIVASRLFSVERARKHLYCIQTHAYVCVFIFLSI